jgi:hypothetical protein
MSLMTLARALHAEAQRQGALESEFGPPRMDDIKVAMGMHGPTTNAGGQVSFRMFTRGSFLDRDEENEYVVTITESRIKA